ncbi:phage holin family protein [Geodermatophilus sp. TF02-6]|uniref:phage holin family protein n=1 Tax=Geodermatophilus sp. TF02-6 TaxID=2250575 RepID=UPI000DE91EF4|nr:phage holin family protein [Geodermatophilus sp. TF02-6]RBY77691.1 phage holin family protein [Geodermatophilus sp. TF02-6]
MTPPVPAGRVLQRGRTTARVLLTWAVTTAALAGLDRWLAGFAMPSWWQPPVIALLLGLLTAVVWPLVMRIALPLALFTLGLGSFLLLGTAVLGLSFLVPGVVIADLETAVVVGVGMAAVSGLVSSVLALDEDELFFRRARRRARRTADGEPRPPGVLFLQIDGLSHDTARRAVRDGSMPNLAAWLRSGSHTLASWHTDWSSQTGASVCGILHGSTTDIPGFRWYDKQRDRVVRVSNPVDAAAVERAHSDGRGLLAGGGASRGNLFTGDAAHVSLTMSSLAHVVPATSRRERQARTRVGSGYYAYFASPVNALRTVAVSLVDVYRELTAAARERRHDVRPRVARGGAYPLARPGTTVITRDVVVYALLEDMLAGRPVAYADFLGYDEAAHHAGLERADSLAVLRGIDQQIGRLHRAAQLAPRAYHLVCLSDHGQTQGASFANRFGETVEELVGRLCGAPAERPGPRLTGPRDSRRLTEGWQVGAVLAEGGPIAQRLRERVERADGVPHPHELPTGREGQVPRVAPGVVVTVSGHAAAVWFPDVPGRVSLEEIERHWPALLPGLVDHDGVGFVLVHSEEDGPVVLGRDGLHRLASGAVLGEDPLLPYGEHAPRLVARVSGFANCADVVVNSRYDPDTDEASAFEPHVGSHGGLGGPQQHGVLVHPRSFRAPGEVVGAEQLHRVLRGWLTDLGHPEPTGDGAAVGPLSPTALRRPADAPASA